MEQFIKRHDEFGSPITLQFNKSENGHYNTVLGGIGSLIIKLIIFIIFVINIE